jgi:flagellar biosynthesis protein FliR
MENRKTFSWTFLPLFSFYLVFLWIFPVIKNELIPKRVRSGAESLQIEP